VRVAARCPCGLPAVIETFPLIDDEPFPTLYWLTCVRACSEIGRIEASGAMGDLTERLHEDADFAAAFDSAQRDYIERRDGLARLEGAGGVGGGPTDRVKCLHAHYAHHLVCGCNPVGAWVDEQVGEVLRPPPCA
jgi:hypothetical protein